MVTRRGWERGPIPYCERDEPHPRATIKVAPTDGDGLFLRLMPIGGSLWSPVGGGWWPFVSLTARNVAPLPSPAGDHEDHPYGPSGLRPLFMASVHAYYAPVIVATPTVLAL